MNTQEIALAEMYKRLALYTDTIKSLEAKQKILVDALEDIMFNYDDWLTKKVLGDRAKETLKKAGFMGEQKGSCD